MSVLSYFQDSFIQKNDIGIVIYDSHDFVLWTILHKKTKVAMIRQTESVIKIKKYCTKKIENFLYDIMIYFLFIYTNKDDKIVINKDFECSTCTEYEKCIFCKFILCNSINTIEFSRHKLDCKSIRDYMGKNGYKISLQESIYPNSLNSHISVFNTKNDIVTSIEFTLINDTNENSLNIIIYKNNSKNTDILILHILSLYKSDNINIISDSPYSFLSEIGFNAVTPGKFPILKQFGFVETNAWKSTRKYIEPFLNI